ncbi:MAG: tetratricopeptide repeat protein [Deltaproteobacteria bacterium]|nr:tetratricopeptide repeat protein [Deltaproteobacteria bacterium]
MNGRTAFYRALLILTVVLSVLTAPGPAAGQKGNTLVQVAMGDGQGYSRVAFTFHSPLGPYTVKNEGGGRVLVDLGPMRLGELGALPRHEVITGLDFITQDDRLLVLVQAGLADYDLKHSTGRDRYTLNLDFLPPPPMEPPAADAAAGAATARPPLILPTLAEVALEQSRQTPPNPHDGPAEHLLQRILGQTADSNRTGALNDVDLFLAHFPNHPRQEVVNYLKAELDFLAGPPQQTYAAAVEDWKSFLARWPNSSLGSRAAYMLAEADRLIGLDNEAAGQFAFLAASEPDDIYAQVALLKAADLFMNLGLVDEARKVLAPVIDQGVGGRLGWEAYARAGAADFYQGFYGQAVDILRETLRQAPEIQDTFPELLYALGESYHYLGQPSLSRHYLFQAVNIMPDHPKTDIILTRIGDNYRAEGLEREAIAIYGAVRRNYPQHEGGLISQVRLADMGALHSFFNQEKVFEALERGSRQATVEMYKIIAGTGFASPLMQLAQLKIGTALAEDGETNEAVKWLRELEINNPRSPLMSEAMPVLNAALAQEIAVRQALGDWQGMVDLYADNSYYLSNADRPRVELMVAQAYERLGRFKEARDMWEALAEETPEKRLARARGLVINSLKIGQPLEALKHILEMEPQFPGQRPWLDEQLEQVGRALARPGDAEAARNLLDLRRAVSAEPVRRDALSDAITIEINGRRYDRAAALINQYRQEYPQDELSPEYLLTLSQIADYQKRPEQAWDILSQFRQNYPDDPRGSQILLDQIAAADRLDRPDDAFRFIELFCAYNPQDPACGALLTEKINRLWEAGRFEESRRALDSFNRDFPEDPRRPEILMSYIERDWEKGRGDREVVEQLLALSPGRPEIPNFLIGLADRGGYEAARELAGLLLARDPDNEALADFLFRRADRSWTEGRYDEARELTDLIMAHYPGDERLASLFLNRAGGNWTRSRYEAALEDWRDFRRAFPESAEIGPSYLEQYKSMMAGGFTEEALGLAEDFRRLRPQDAGLQADLMLEQAKDFFALNRPQEGLDMWSRFRQTFPEDERNPDLLLIQARQELKSGLTDEALGHYREYLERYDKGLPDVYLETAAVEAAHNQEAAAWDRLGRYLATFPAHPGRAQAFQDAAELGQRLGRPAEAAALWERYRREFPTSASTPGAYLAEARLRLAAGDQAGALATLESGALSQPALNKDPQVRALLAELYLEEGRVEDWAAQVERNLAEAGPEVSDRFQKYYQLAQVYLELGRHPDAERNLDSAMANRNAGVAAENLYAAAQGYKSLLRRDKYRAGLLLVQEANDPFWGKLAAEELAAE